MCDVHDCYCHIKTLITGAIGGLAVLDDQLHG